MLMTKLCTPLDQINDLQSAVNSGKVWLANFNTVKTNLLSISMAHPNLQVSDKFSPIGQTFSEDMKWKFYIKSFAWSAARNVGLLSRARQLFSSETMFISPFFECF